MALKKRHPVRNSDIRGIVEELKPVLGEEIENLLDGRVETGELDSGERVILVDGRPVLVEIGNRLIPLASAAERLSLKRVTVDMGAVGPISDGADIMAPGIVEVGENIGGGEIVGIEDEKNHKIIAVGLTHEEGESLKGEEGKVIGNLHYVGDKYWALLE